MKRARRPWNGRLTLLDGASRMPWASLRGRVYTAQVKLWRCDEMMIARGITLEMSDGTLWCDGTLTVLGTIRNP